MKANRKADRKKRQYIKAAIKELQGYEAELKELKRLETSLLNEQALFNHKQGVLTKNTNLLN